MKVLINVPPLEYTGGVSGHYRGLKNHWSVNVKYNTIIKKSNNKYSKILIPFNFVKFLVNTLIFNPQLILLNVSIKKGLYSLLLYYKLARLVNKKVAIFIHGWDEEYESKLNIWKIKKIFNSCVSIFVLSNDFRIKLANYQINTPVYVTTTKVSDELVKEFDISKRKGEIKNFLFVSRLEKEKGVFIALEIFSKLIKNDPSLSFTIVGDGKAEDDVKDFIKNKNIQNVRMTGRLFEKGLKKEFNKADFFLFISYHGEGLPAALLEAFAFGLPVATRPVGGIKDFFIDKKMGIISDSLDANYYYNEIKVLMNDKEKVQQISKFNYEYAQKNFLASSVAKKMEEIFYKSLNNL